MSEAVPPGNGLKALYGALWRHAAGARGRYVAAMGLLAVSQLLKLAMPWAAAQAINTLQRGGAGSLAAAGCWIAAIAATLAGVWLLHGPGRVLERNVALRVRRSLADALTQRIAHAPLTWHERRHSGDLQHRVQQACSALTDFTQNQFIYLQNAMNLGGPLVALTLLSPATGALALAGYLGIGGVIIAFDRALMRLAEQENSLERRYAARLLDTIGNIGTLLALKLQAPSRRLLDQHIAATQTPKRRGIVLTEWKWCGVDMLSVSLSWGLVAFYAWQAPGAAQAVMFGSLFMVYQYAQQAAGVIGAMASHYQSFERAKTNFASAAPIWEAPFAPPPSGSAGPWRRLHLEGLSYRHADGRGVEGIDIELRRGERLALVGASGCGKSTLLRLLAGLYPAQAGSMRLDDGRTVTPAVLTADATLITQEAELFDASLRENLAFGEPVAEAALLHALHVSAFDRVLSALPQGLETPIVERGANLSGGQRQRLALARGVLAARDCSLLLLDEPTSALDPATELLVHERLHDAFAGVCIVASVHRMDLLAHYDRVAFMRDGRLLDIGTVEQVASRQPAFAQSLHRGKQRNQDGLLVGRAGFEPATKGL